MNFIDITTTSLLTKVFKAVLEGSKLMKVLFGVALLCIMTAIAIATLADSGIINRYYNLVAGILGGIGAVFIFYIYVYQSTLEEREAKAQIKIVEDRVKENPNEPTAAWELARIKLENYLNRNLSQIQWIFIWTILVMIAGFVIIGYGIMKSYQAETQLNTSIVTTVCGLLVEFIGATFLVIYKSTMGQAKDYVNVLERINAVGMSVQILDSISEEESKLQDQTKAEIAKQLLALYAVKP